MGYLKTELSRDSKWHISKHRYLELRHFCLQYPEWKQMLRDMDDVVRGGSLIFADGNGVVSDETARIGIIRAIVSSNIDLIETTCERADPDLARYLLIGVTEDRSFPSLQAKEQIPCGKDMYYDRYRRFFYLLDKEHK